MASVIGDFSQALNMSSPIAAKMKDLNCKKFMLVKFWYLISGKKSTHIGKWDICDASSRTALEAKNVFSVSSILRKACFSNNGFRGLWCKQI